MQMPTTLVIFCLLIRTFPWANTSNLGGMCGEFFHFLFPQSVCVTSVSGGPVCHGIWYLLRQRLSWAGVLYPTPTSNETHTAH